MSTPAVDRWPETTTRQAHRRSDDPRSGRGPIPAGAPAASSRLPRAMTVIAVPRGRRNAVDLVERDGRRHGHPLHPRLVLAQPQCQRHRKARRMRGRRELLGARLALRRLRSCRPRHRQRVDRTAVAAHRALPGGQRSVPDRLRTSTRDRHSQLPSRVHDYYSHHLCENSGHRPLTKGSRRTTTQGREAAPVETAPIRTEGLHAIAASNAPCRRCTRRVLRTRARASGQRTRRVNTRVAPRNPSSASRPRTAARRPSPPARARAADLGCAPARRSAWPTRGCRSGPPAGEAASARQRSRCAPGRSAL